MSIATFHLRLHSQYSILHKIAPYLFMDKYLFRTPQTIDYIHSLEFFNAALLMIYSNFTASKIGYITYSLYLFSSQTLTVVPLVTTVRVFCHSYIELQDWSFCFFDGVQCHVCYTLQKKLSAFFKFPSECYSYINLHKWNILVSINYLCIIDECSHSNNQLPCNAALQLSRIYVCGQILKGRRLEFLNNYYCRITHTPSPFNCFHQYYG